MLPQAAWGAPIKDQSPISGGKGAPPDLAASKKPKVIHELREHRDQHVKHYFSDDGSRTVDVSPILVHVETIILLQRQNA
ncbi:hypothetical protein SDC9_36634 [bioreactor metagenome]|uniref:Uncharacterized protein n=2 Tax=root TaxID=1 RepID=G9XMI5_DESHA|nr:hypothetical protein HMPREF0322_02172 [Desulfitobacterium hafniense DP7]